MALYVFMNTAKEYWQGSKPLWKSFWLIYILGAFIVPIAIALVTFTVAPVFQVSSIQLSALVSLLLFLFNPYYIYSWVSVWRSTRNTSKQIYGYMAKIIVLLHIIYFSFSIIMLFINYESIQ